MLVIYLNFFVVYDFRTFRLEAKRVKCIKRFIIIQAYDIHISFHLRTLLLNLYFKRFIYQMSLRKSALASYLKLYI